MTIFVSFPNTAIICDDDDDDDDDDDEMFLWNVDQRKTASVFQDRVGAISRREQDLNLCNTWIQALFNTVVQ